MLFFFFLVVCLLKECMEKKFFLLDLDLRVANNDARTNR